MTHIKHTGHGTPSNEFQLSSFATLFHELHSFFLKRTPCNSFSKYLLKYIAEVNTGDLHLAPLTTCGLIRDGNRVSYGIFNIVPEMRSYYAMDTVWARQCSISLQISRYYLLVVWLWDRSFTSLILHIFTCKNEDIGLDPWF